MPSPKNANIREPASAGRLSPIGPRNCPFRKPHRCRFSVYYRVEIWKRQGANSERSRGAWQRATVAAAKVQPALRWRLGLVCLGGADVSCAPQGSINGRQFPSVSQKTAARRRSHSAGGCLLLDGILVRTVRFGYMLLRQTRMRAPVLGGEHRLLISPVPGSGTAKCAGAAGAQRASPPGNVVTTLLYLMSNKIATKISVEKPHLIGYNTDGAAAAPHHKGLEVEPHGQN